MISLEPIPGPSGPKFDPGEVVVTPGIIAVMNRMEIRAALLRHVSGDWGELDPEDRQTNERALEQGGRLLSVYQTKQGIKYYVITEANREVTTFLLPEEY